MMMIDCLLLDDASLGDVVFNFNFCLNKQTNMQQIIWQYRISTDLSYGGMMNDGAINLKL